MADIINEIVSEQALKQVDDLKKGLAELLTAFKESATAAALMEKALKSSGDPMPNIKETNELVKEMQRQIKALQTENAKLTLAQTQYNKSLIETRIAKNETNKQIIEEIKLSKVASDSITKKEAELKALKKQYSDMSAAQRESTAAGKEMAENIKKLVAELAPLKKSLNGIQEAAPKIKEVKVELSEMDKLVSKTATKQQQSNIVNTEVNKKYQELSVSINKTNREIRDEIALANANRNSLERAELLIKKWTNEQKKLNLATAEGIRLNQSYNKAIEKASTYTKTYGNVVDKQRKNIGNYRNETFQLSQVIRELPAFTYSASTGIMALSNNLPMLGDGFWKVARAVNKTTGEVNGVSGALKIFGASIFSLPNLFAIAVGLFTIFNEEILTFIGLNKKAEEGVNDLEKSIGQETAKFESLNRQLNNNKLSREQQLRAAKEMQKLYPKVLSNYTQEEILAGKAASAILKIEKALIAVAMARAAENDLADMAAKRYENEKKIAELRAKSIAQAKKGQQDLNNTFRNGSESAAMNAARSASALSSTEDKISSLTKENKKLSKSMDEVAAKIASYGYPYDVLGEPDKDKDKDKKKKKKDKKLKFDFTPIDLVGVDPEQPSKDLKYVFDKAIKVREWYKDEALRLLDEEFAYGLMSTKEYEKNKLKLVDTYDELKLVEIIETGKNLLSNEKLLGDQRIDIEEKVTNAQIELAKKRAEKKKGILKEEAEEWAWFYNEVDKMIKEEEQEELDRYKAFNKVMQATFEGAKEIGDVLFERQKMRIDEEKRMVEDRYKREEELIKANFTTIEERDKALARLNASKLAEEERIRQKELQMRQRQARFNKALDISSIGTTTALAIMVALADKSVSAALRIANAIAAGVTGAAQLAKAIATPIPQYAEGTDNAKGGLSIVGEKGTELVIEPSGKKYLTPSQDTLVNLPKGSKVIPNNELDKYLYANPTIRRFNSTSSNNQIINYEELRGDVKELTSVMKRKSLSVNIKGDSVFYQYQKSKIR